LPAGLHPFDHERSQIGATRVQRSGEASRSGADDDESVMRHAGRVMASARDRKAGSSQPLTHLDAHGRARMVDVSAKAITERVAVATATLRMRAATLRLIRSGGIAKGEVLAVARVAGIQAAKHTADLIPLCHPLPVETVSIDFTPRAGGRLQVTATVKVTGKTGVEMEALTAASAAALTVYDMCKAVDRGMVITDIGLLEKRGGRTGTWRRTRRDDRKLRER
jgi:cyclic pyranopterin phosphate synthase